MIYRNNNLNTNIVRVIKNISERKHGQNRFHINDVITRLRMKVMTNSCYVFSDQYYRTE